MMVNKIKIIGLKNKIQVRINDFNEILKNQGPKTAILKTLRFIYKKFLKKNEDFSQNLRKVIIFSTQPLNIIKKINIENQSPNRLFLTKVNSLTIINPEKVEKNNHYIIFCLSNEYISESLYIRSQSWKNKLITTSEVLNRTSEIDQFLYVDHIVDKSHMKNGFIGNLNEDFDRYYEFYTSLWGFESRKFGFLNLQNEPEKTIDSVRSEKKKYSIHVKYDINNLEMSSCQTFAEIIEKCNIEILKVTEDVFWQFNKYTQSDRINCKAFLKEALAKGAFISGESK